MIKNCIDLMICWKSDSQKNWSMVSSIEKLKKDQQNENHQTPNSVWVFDSFENANSYGALPSWDASLQDETDTAVRWNVSIRDRESLGGLVDLDDACNFFLLVYTLLIFFFTFNADIWIELAACHAATANLDNMYFHIASIEICKNLN